MKIGKEPTKGYKAFPCLKNLTTNLHSEQQKNWSRPKIRYLKENVPTATL